MLDYSIQHEVRATWQGTDKIPESGWAVVRVFRRAPGFCFGELLHLGYDHVKPGESQFAAELRIAKRFEVGDLMDLVLRVTP